MSACFRPRFAMLAAFLVAAVFAAPVTVMGQAPSRAIDALQPVAQGDRVGSHANFAPLTQLEGQLPSWVAGQPQSAARPVDVSTPITATLVLRRDPAAQAAFEQLLADQQNPNSPRFRQWLTPQQVGRLFGPTENDLASLTGWLTSQGLKVESISPSGVLVAISGSAAVLGNALHTSFGMFDPNPGSVAEPRISAIVEPSIPTALAPLVRSIHGLTQVPVQPTIHARAVLGAKTPLTSGSSAARPMITLSDGEHFLAPGDFAVIYDINSVYNGGNKGATIGTNAQHVAVIGESAVTNTDITLFESATGLPNATPTVVVPTGGVNPGVTGNSLQDEATLDVDRVYATAPGAIVDLVVSKTSATEDGIFIAMQYNVNTLLDPVMTLSFGACEVSAGASAVNFVDEVASAGAAEGITTLVSSGDSGVAGCDASFSTAPTTQVASINFICSSSYVTCVGGTEFNDTSNPLTYWSKTNSSTYVSALSYIPEGAWNEPSTVSNNVTKYAPAASGGGVSLYIAKPTWQTGTGVPADGFRDVPDVSLAAASHDGYFACLAYAGGNCPDNFEDFSGTSAAAPGMAGIVALVNTKLGTSVGNINPQLYALATSTPAAFHDATIATSGVTGCTSSTPSMCNNSTPAPAALTGGLKGFDLTTGFDLATGLGSVDVAELVTAVGGSAALTSTTLALTAASNPITAGGSTTFTATLTPAAGATGTPSGTVQFYSNGNAFGSPVTLTGDKATSAAETFATAGTYSITAIYSGDTTFATSPAAALSLVVNAAATPGTFTLAASPATLSVTPTASTNGSPIAGTATSTITATSTNGFAASIQLSCAITPATTAPPTCTMSPISITPVANGTATSTLTISFVGPTSNCNTTELRATPRPGLPLGGIALASLLLLVLPVRKRQSLKLLSLVCLLTAGIASLSGCGGGNTIGVVCSNAITGGTTPGTYTVTVTGANSTVTPSPTTTVALTVH